MQVYCSVRVLQSGRQYNAQAVQVQQQVELVCRQHPWFSQHLPRYLAVIQADTMASEPVIDEETVNEVVKIGFDRDTVIRSLKARQQDKVPGACHCLAFCA